MESNEIFWWILFVSFITLCHVTMACPPSMFSYPDGEDDDDDDTEVDVPMPVPTEPTVKQTELPAWRLPPRWDKDQADDGLHFVMIGDIGGSEYYPYTTEDQLRTAEAMTSLAATFHLDFIAELGDNFYHNGVRDVNDTRFQDTFESVYDSEPLRDVPWYVIAGNHDWDGNVSAQIEYSKISERWNYPSLFYSERFAIPNTDGAAVRLIMVDTMVICGNIDHSSRGAPPVGTEEKRTAERQLIWLENELLQARESYVIVAGHYPVWSIGSHGPTDCLVDKIKPMLEKYNVTAYFGAHDHCLQHIQETGSQVEYFVSGGGHLMDPSTPFIDSVPPDWQRFHFGRIRSQGGFAYVSATAQNMTVTFTDSVEMNDLYETTIMPRYY